MPDLTIETAMVCASNESWQGQYEGSKGEYYTVEWGRKVRGPVQYGWSCSCPAFKFGRGRECKHIEAAKTERCAWNAEMSVGGTDLDKCPECNGPVSSVRVAV